VENLLDEAHFAMRWGGGDGDWDWEMGCGWDYDDGGREGKIRAMCK
tara:strand:- start:951 stop:1088 length:138 start_codon:yes stop_codon:yes gene_type:complete